MNKNTKSISMQIPSKCKCNVQHIYSLYLTTFKLSLRALTSEGLGLIYSLTEVISYHSNSGADSQAGV